MLDLFASKLISWSILEIKGMGAISQKKGKEQAKIFENLGKNVGNLKIFCNRVGNCIL